MQHIITQTHTYICIYIYTYITLHCVALHCIALHCIALHDMTWHDIHSYTDLHWHISRLIWKYIQETSKDTEDSGRSRSQRLTFWTCFWSCAGAEELVCSMRVHRSGDTAIFREQLDWPKFSLPKFGPSNMIRRANFSESFEPIWDRFGGSQKSCQASISKKKGIFSGRRPVITIQYISILFLAGAFPFQKPLKIS